MSVTTAHPNRQSDRRVPGEIGVWIVIFGDLLAFAALFCTYMYYRAEWPVEFAESHLVMNRDIGIINTLLLLFASLAVVQGVHAYRARALVAANRAFAVAIISGVGFLVLKSIEYGQKLSESLSPNTNIFFTLYYTFTGIHFLHVLLGIAVLIYVRTIASRKIPDVRDGVVIESGASFWHLVDLLWIVLFALFYLVG